MRIDIGTTFAGYTVVSRLGRGGMATVYLGREPQLERLVALKVLPEADAGDTTYAERFAREARIIGQLDHPNIVPLYRFGIEGDVPWMALRYVNGGDLATTLRQQSLPMSEGLRMIGEIASALDFAHSKGVIHRDLKPQNVLLSDKGWTYLADFGVAKLLAGTRLSATDSVLGTPAYMSPEQAQAQPLGPASDIYALAVMTFQWLTGELPFEADTPVATLLKHIQSPLPEAPLERLPPAVRATLVAGLEKDPSRRPSSAGEFARRLADAAERRDSAPVRSPPPRPTEAILERPFNLGFDGPSSRGMPLGWSDGFGQVSNVATDYQIRLQQRSSEASAGMCAVLEMPQPAHGRFGTLMQRCRARFLAGRTVRIEADLRSDSVVEWAGLWLRADADDLPNLFFDNMAQRPIVGTTPWTRYGIDAPLPAATDWLNFGIVLAGSGTLWIDDIRIRMWTANGEWADI